MASSKQTKFNTSVYDDLASLNLGTPMSKDSTYYSVVFNADIDSYFKKVKLGGNIYNKKYTSILYTLVDFKDIIEALINNNKLDSVCKTLVYKPFPVVMPNGTTSVQGCLEFELVNSTPKKVYDLSIKIMDTISKLIDEASFNVAEETPDITGPVLSSSKAIKPNQLPASSASAAPFVPSNGITFASVSAPKATATSLIANRTGTPFAALFPSLITDSPSSRPSTQEAASRVPVESNSDKLARLLSETEELSEEQKQIAEEQKQLAKQLEELSAKQIKNSGKIDFNNSEIASLKDVVKAEEEARNAALKKEKASRIAALKQQLLDAERELAADNDALLNETERAKQYSAKTGEGWHSEHTDDA